MSLNRQSGQRSIHDAKIRSFASDRKAQKSAPFRDAKIRCTLNGLLVAEMALEATSL